MLLVNDDLIKPVIVFPLCARVVMIGWTKENLQRLLAAMKAGIPERNRLSSYRAGLNTLDWNEVAFPPFSPEECQKKWMEFMEKVGPNIYS